MIEEALLTEETHLILHRILDKADAGRTRLQLKCNSKETPELYDFDDQHQVNAVWDDLKVLAKQGIVELRLQSHQRPGYEEYHDGRIILRYESEPLIRQWLQRPAFDPQMHLWHTAIDQYQHCFEDGGEALKKEVIPFLGRNYEHVVKAFSCIPEVLAAPQTLRQLSSSCFWGESKFLEKRQALIIATFPSLAKNIKRRPLLLSVCLTSSIDTVLFVENQDTFLELAALNLSDISLVYLGGFRGTAIRVREPGNTVFSYLNQASLESQNLFEQFWLGQQQRPCYFWGDLDYAGMSILKALKQVFPAVEAWPQGYDPMVKILKQGLGHSPGVQNKERQIEPDGIGCTYSEYVLLPTIEEYGAFLDQEAIPVSSIQF